jgi:hypothetical protein
MFENEYKATVKLVKDLARDEQYLVLRVTTFIPVADEPGTYTRKTQSYTFQVPSMDHLASGHEYVTQSKGWIEPDVETINYPKV